MASLTEVGFTSPFAVWGEIAGKLMLLDHSLEDPLTTAGKSATWHAERYRDAAREIASCSRGLEPSAVGTKFLEDVGRMVQQSDALLDAADSQAAAVQATFPTILTRLTLGRKQVGGLARVAVAVSHDGVITGSAFRSFLEGLYAALERTDQKTIFSFAFFLTAGALLAAGLRDWDQA